MRISGFHGGNTYLRFFRLAHANFQRSSKYLRIRMWLLRKDSPIFVFLSGFVKKVLSCVTRISSAVYWKLVFGRCQFIDINRPDAFFARLDLLLDEWINVERIVWKSIGINIWTRLNSFWRNIELKVREHNLEFSSLVPRDPMVFDHVNQAHFKACRNSSCSFLS